MRIKVFEYLKITVLLLALNAYILPVLGVFISVRYITRLINRVCVKQPVKRNV